MRSEEKILFQFQPPGTDLNLCPADLLAGSGHGCECGLHPSIANSDPSKALGTAGAAFHGALAGNYVGSSHCLGISIVLGLGLAVLMDANDTARRALYPLIIASQTIPTTALAPLFVLWFGYSIWGKVLVTVLITFFPITITVFDGFQSVKTEMEELLFTFGASSAQIFWKLKVPAVLPYFFSAIKMAVPLSIIGAAIGEWLGAQSGLGYFSRRMMTQLDGAGVFAPILLLSVVAMIFVWLVTLLEKRMIRWRNDL